jgi:hypothetical protein
MKMSQKLTAMMPAGEPELLDKRRLHQVSAVELFGYPIEEAAPDLPHLALHPSNHRFQIHREHQGLCPHDLQSLPEYLIVLIHYLGLLREGLSVPRNLAFLLSLLLHATFEDY